VWTEPATLRVFESLVSDLDTEGNAPLEVVTDVIPGVDARIQASIWVPKGFWHRAKVRLRREPSAVLAPKRTTGEFRLIRPGDIEALVPVYAAAYSDRPGEFWTWDTPDAVGEAQAGLRRLVEESGAWAPGFYSEASYVCLRENTVCGAVLVDLGADGTPSFEDLIVAPGEQRTGLGRELMRRALNACRAGGDRAVELSAIRYGAPYRLYRELGFREVEGPRVVLDGHWVRGEDPTGGHGAE
jgi:GNAT superfamily N-acetyltransferase